MVEIPCNIFRAYGLYCDKVQELENGIIQQQKEYQSKLIVNEETIPDPLKLSEGWAGENDAIENWPSLYYLDIANMLNQKGPDFIHRMETE